ncbi:MAG: dynamin family protein [Acidobacteria bacterium]|nr:dynamin family protein [Acidobacteriota bacterium]
MQIETQTDSSIALVEDLSARYAIHSIRPLLGACRAAARRKEFQVAVIGRFKAGKSSFLNRLMGVDLLPVGVTPVTSVITRIRFGSAPRMVVRFLDGRTMEPGLEHLPAYVTESQNPENVKEVESATVESGNLSRFPSICFVDTPGLDSVFAHNTETARAWMPNVDLALIAVGVDPPLSHHDVALLKTLYEFTPRVAVLLTKFDLLDRHDSGQVLSFVRDQLLRQLDPAPPVFPYSSRVGFESLHAAVESELLIPAVRRLEEERALVLSHKTSTLLNECEDSLRLALGAAEATDSERSGLNQLVLGEKDSLAEFKTQLRLITLHAAGGSRQHIAAVLEACQSPIEAALADELRARYPQWKSLAMMIPAFQEWLEHSLHQRLAQISAANRSVFLRPVDQASSQLVRSLQDFRNRLSERTFKAYGVRLRTTGIEMQITDPRTPDINIGKVFDRNWELLSMIIPMSLVGGLVYRHLANRKMPYEVYKNLSRLATQWEESVNVALRDLLAQANHRLDEWMTTLDGLLSRTSGESSQIQEDLAKLSAAQAAMRQG